MSKRDQCLLKGRDSEENSGVAVGVSRNEGRTEGPFNDAFVNSERCLKKCGDLSCGESHFMCLCLYNMLV